MKRWLLIRIRKFEDGAIEDDRQRASHGVSRRVWAVEGVSGSD